MTDISDMAVQEKSIADSQKEPVKRLQTLESLQFIDGIDVINEHISAELSFK